MSLHSDKVWCRMVINNWVGAPFSRNYDVHQAVNWLVEAGDPLVFATRRGRSNVSLGVQIWCVAPEVQLCVHMMAAPVLHTQEYSPTDFESQLKLMLKWMLPP
jgi:hypothetical protein